MSHPFTPPTPLPPSPTFPFTRPSSNLVFGTAIQVHYVNWRGEATKRRIIPLSLYLDWLLDLP